MIIELLHAFKINEYFPRPKCRDLFKFKVQLANVEEKSFNIVDKKNIFQTNGVWVTNTGKRVQLRDVFLPSLTEVERVVLQKQASEKIQQLGVTLTPQGDYNTPALHVIKNSFTLYIHTNIES